MSLFGTGRREGVLACALLAALVAGLHLATAAGGPISLSTSTAGLAGLLALGGITCYRFLRAAAASRFAAFLGGTAYGTAPMLAKLADAPHELWPAATAPLALEAARRWDRATSRARFAPWTGLLMALPFAVGPTAIGCGAIALALVILAKNAIAARTAEPSVVRAALLAVLVAALAGANLCWLEPVRTWLGPRVPLAAAAVFDGAPTPLAIVRALGPVPIWFALLGILRYQRRVPAGLWLLCLVAGGALGAFVDPAAFWAAVLAAIVLGTAGLDDWLDNPLRRRGAHLLLLLLTLLGAPALTIASAGDPVQLTTVLGTFAVLAVATLTWRVLGVLRFKNALAVVVLLALAAPIALGFSAHTSPARPLGEFRPADLTTALWHLAALPWQQYAGVLASVSTAAIWALLGALRRQR